MLFILVNIVITNLLLFKFAQNIGEKNSAQSKRVFVILHDVLECYYLFFIPNHSNKTFKYVIQKEDHAQHIKTEF